VARLTQALQLAGHEGVPLATVRSDVIDHVRRRNDAALEAELAQRMALQLQLPQPLPAPSLVEAIPFNRVVASNSHERALNPRQEELWPVQCTSYPARAILQQ